MQGLIEAMEQRGTSALEPGDDDPDAFEARVYTDMLKAVQAVFEELVRVNKPFRAWLEYT